MIPVKEVHRHIDASGLIDGFSALFYRWYEEDVAASAGDCILFRPEGGRGPNELQQFPGVSIAVSTMSASETYEKALEIRDYLIENNTTDAVTTFEIVGDIVGPSEMENRRNVCQLNLIIWT